MRPFAFAVSIILYTAADADAPFGVSAKSQFFLPTVKGRMAFSAVKTLRPDAHDARKNCFVLKGERLFWWAKYAKIKIVYFGGYT